MPRLEIRVTLILAISRWSNNCNLLRHVDHEGLGHPRGSISQGDSVLQDVDSVEDMQELIYISLFRIFTVRLTTLYMCSR